MKKVKCPCCEGTGMVEWQLPLPTALTNAQAQIYRLIRARPNIMGAKELVTLLYSDRADGGPDNAMATVHTIIHHINNRLSVAGEKIVANRRGPGAVYRVEKLHVV